VKATPKQIVDIPKKFFVRDVATFFFVTTLLIFLGFLKLKLYYITVIFFSIYLVYVVIVLYMEFQEKEISNSQKKISNAESLTQIEDAKNNSKDSEKIN